MEAYYEYERESNLKFDIVSPCHLIGAHFHSNLEVFLVKSGAYQITKNGVTCHMSRPTHALCEEITILTTPSSFPPPFS
jgi:hypothetical protein